jgi:2-amino-4-hydroxy-6-hydroxymethyldihydropteridine diphosphokinase
MGKTVKTVILALGSNLGNRLNTINSAIQKIESEVGEIISIADCIETAPFEMESVGNFLNSCIEIETELTVWEVLKKLQKIEIDLGRPKNTKGKNESRTIDIDIIFYDSEMIETTELCIPHKEYHTRSFVLIPLLQIAPNFIDPSKHLTVKQLIN